MYVCINTFSCLQVCGRKCWRPLVCWQWSLTVWSLESHQTLFHASSIITVMAPVLMEAHTHSQSYFSWQKHIYTSEDCAVSYCVFYFILYNFELQCFTQKISILCLCGLSIYVNKVLYDFGWPPSRYNYRCHLQAHSFFIFKLTQGWLL